jgi:hypothetical protein
VQIYEPQHARLNAAVEGKGVRGGAIPLMCWAVLLTVTGTLNAVWTGDLIQMGTFTAAVLAISLTAISFIVRAPEAAKRGEPGPRTASEAIPTGSFASAFTAVGLGVLLFGLVFGHFPIYLGAGMIVTGLGRLALELRAQRRAVMTRSERIPEGTDQ